MKHLIGGVSPSVPDALFRLLMRDPSLAYLRDNDTILGFELCEDSSPLTGYIIIGLKKQTIFAYKSDIGLPEKLILFPSLDKLFDEEFGLLNLKVKKVRIQDDSFKGVVLDTGIMRNLVKDLTPTFKSASLSDSEIEKINDVFDEKAIKEDIPEHEFIDEPFDEPFIDDPFIDEFIEEPTKGDLLMMQSFKSLDDLTRFLIVDLGVNKDIVDKMINIILYRSNGSKYSNDELIITIQKLFKRAFDDNKL